MTANMNRRTKRKLYRGMVSAQLSIILFIFYFTPTMGKVLIMKKFIVEALYRKCFMVTVNSFSSRNAAIRFARQHFELHGDDLYINGRRLKFKVL